jgi:hypothetical protein
MDDRERLKVMRRYVVAGTALLLGITVLVMAFAVQDHDDRVLASLPLLKRMGLRAAVRASCYGYTSTEEIDQLISGLQRKG